MQMLASPDDPVHQCRDILLYQIHCALEALDARHGEVNVHAARKQLKKARATLRMLRPAIGDDRYRRENIAARDAARPLSQVRDSQVLSDALDGLLRWSGEPASALKLDSLEDSFRKRRKGTHAKQLRQQSLASVKEALLGMEARITRWRITNDEWEFLARGTRATYRRGRRELREASSEPSTSNLHEWRKRTKYLWHQLQILTPLAPGTLGELADEFHTLADYLGDEHDLAVLREQASVRPHGTDKDAASSLKTLIDRRRDELQGKAFTLGERLYADGANAFAARITKHWSHWAETHKRSKGTAPPKRSMRSRSLASRAEGRHRHKP